MNKPQLIKGTFATRTVFIGSRELDPAASLELVNHSPTGFNWGYGGSGPAQLALALLLEYAGKDFALANYGDFKWDVIAALPSGDFTMSSRKVVEWILSRKEHLRQLQAGERVHSD